MQQSGLQYRKLFFIWYFDDNTGYGIEVFGQRISEKEMPNSCLVSLVNWSFGKGTQARDLRRVWGEYAANRAQENGGMIPLDIIGIHLRYDPVNNQIMGDLDKMNDLLNK